jgi:hypothetical protein
MDNEVYQRIQDYCLSQLKENGTREQILAYLEMTLLNFEMLNRVCDRYRDEIIKLKAKEINHDQ